MTHCQNPLTKNIAQFTNRIKLLNQIGVYVIACLSAYILWEAYSLSHMSRIIPQNRDHSMPQIVYSPSIEQLAKKEDFARNIFQPFKEPKEVRKVILSDINNFKERYRVVGVFMGVESVVMIENTANHEILSLKQGDVIEDAEIEQIELNQVQFNFRGKKIILES